MITFQYLPFRKGSCLLPQFTSCVWLHNVLQFRAKERTAPWHFAALVWVRTEQCRGQLPLPCVPHFSSVLQPRGEERTAALAGIRTEQWRGRVDFVRLHDTRAASSRPLRAARTGGAGAAETLAREPIDRGHEPGAGLQARRQHVDAFEVQKQSRPLPTP